MEVRATPLLPLSFPETSLLTGNSAGNFAENGQIGPATAEIRAFHQELGAKFPASPNREFFSVEQRIFCQNREFDRVVPSAVSGEIEAELTQRREGSRGRKEPKGPLSTDSRRSTRCRSTSDPNRLRLGTDRRSCGTWILPGVLQAGAQPKIMAASERHHVTIQQDFSFNSRQKCGGS